MASPVVEMWAASETLMGLAATGRLAVTPNEKLTRDDLVLNEEVLTPLLKHLGVRVTLSQIQEHVDLFLHYARPKGKAALPRSFFQQLFVHDFVVSICDV